MIQSRRHQSLTGAWHGRSVETQLDGLGQDSADDRRRLGPAGRGSRGLQSDGANGVTWEPVDIIAMIFAAALAVSVVLAVVGAVLTVFILKQPISDKRSSNAAPIVMAMVAAVALYIGAKVGATSENLVAPGP